MTMGQLNDIRFSKTNGGMGRTAASEDPISGLMMFLPELSEADLVSATNTLQFDSMGKPDEENAVFAAKIRYADELEAYGLEIQSMDEDDISALTTAEFKKRAAINALVYHVREFFRMNETGTLYLAIKSTGSNIEQVDIEALQNYSNGVIRQCGVLVPKMDKYAEYQSACTSLEKEHKPMSVVITTSGKTKTYNATPNTTPPRFVATTTDVPEMKLTNLISSTTNYVGDGRCNISILVGCDLDGDTLNMLAQYGYYGCIGACIGAISKAAVNECIAWVQKFPLGLQSPGLVCGDLVKDVTVNNLSLINDNRYLFVRNHVGDADCYFNDSHTLDLATSDNAYIENVRTIDKACRGIRKNLLPYLNSPLYVDSETGKLQSNMVAFLETTAGKALEDMEKAGELSGYSVEINPEQNVLSTSEVEIIIKKVPVGVMRKVLVKIGYTTSLN